MESLSQWGGCPTQLPLYPCAWHRSSESTFLPQGSSLLGYSQAPPLRLPCISLWPNFPLKSTRRLSFMSKKGLSSPRPISTLTPGARSKSRPTFTGLRVGWPWTPHTPDSGRLQPVPRHPHSVCPGAGSAAASGAPPGCSVSGKRPFSCPSLFWEVSRTCLSGAVFIESHRSYRNCGWRWELTKMAPSASPRGFISSKPRDSHPNRRPSRPFSYCQAYTGHIQVQVCENKLGKGGWGVSDGNVPWGGQALSWHPDRQDGLFSILFPFCYMTVQCTRWSKVSFPSSYGRGHVNDFNQWNVSRHHPLGELRCSRELWLICSILRAAFAWRVSMWSLPGAYQCYHYLAQE